MTASKQVSVALSIAGSDSGGGAGIQADVKTFASLGVHGTTAVTCVTAQNPTQIAAIQPCKPDMVRAQIESVFEELPPAAVKTGMLYSAEIVRVVVAWFKHGQRPPLVVDPVMRASSGSALLRSSSVQVLFNELLPLAALVTPNLDEAGVLIGGKKPGSVEDMRHAARQIHEQFGCAALVKGGHLHEVKQAVDIFYDGKEEWLLEAPFVRRVSTHGTGCTYSAAITAFLARGHNLGRSVEFAKRYITQAIAAHHTVCGHQTLNSCWRKR